jgi:nicotinamidase-related amidase
MADDRPSVAVLALHYQNEVLHPEGKIRFGFAQGAGGRDAVIDAAHKLLQGARKCGVPVISVRIDFRPDYADVLTNCAMFRGVVSSQAMQEGSWGARFYDGLGPLPGEFIVHHARINAFYGSRLEEILNKLGARTLYMAGIATNYVVEGTARHAVDAGYRVFVVRDACSAATPEAHEASLKAMGPLADIVAASDAAAAFDAFAPRT